jgi:Cyclic nucleotide-binding domain
MAVPHTGDYFGELALLPGSTTRAATVCTRSDVSLLVLDRSHFESLMGPLMPQLEAAAKNYTGYHPTRPGGVAVRLQQLAFQGLVECLKFRRVSGLKDRNKKPVLHLFSAKRQKAPGCPAAS